ncbi:sigma-70 family RNA polymerase sigma factor [Phenylobacterium sp. LjRoot225]|uniref:RNA polymerase sigma factor n=1 Tax=Phenylobacterium sp. LjRoot225 TaxID=3342285 RepID=UPI003ED08594
MLSRPRTTHVDGGPAAETAARRDARLIARIAEGEPRAFEELYRLYQPRLTRFLSGLLRRPHLIEEVLDDTLLRVWDRPDAYNGASKVSTWIFAIAYRKALKVLKRCDEPVDDAEAADRPTGEPGPEAEFGRRQAREALLQAMAELSLEQKTVVELCYFHEMGYREIADIMGCPVDTVKTRMFHARRRMKASLARPLADWL